MRSSSKDANVRYREMRVTGTGRTATLVNPAVHGLDTISQRTADIVKRLEEQDKARKWALMIAGASALFVAVKLGLIAFSHIESRVTG